MDDDNADDDDGGGDDDDDGSCNLGDLDTDILNMMIYAHVNAMIMMIWL